MKLRQLELRGFKTFAHATDFLFPAGITAIVGPNGSGKSNFADAIRWVLGEQSMRAVRGKRTEDVIFAGAAGKAQAGMAEVSLLLDNTSGWMPVSMSEVKITRRAYRSGDNEYLLNGRKLRLRELNELLLKAGVGDSAFVVIGQGMVDLALTLRAEERRGLIEEAADVKRFYVKLDETRDKLAITEQALARARDLATEIEPRLAGLAIQADRLQEHQTLSADLFGLLRRWHSHVRDQLAGAMDAAEARVASGDIDSADLKAQLEREVSRLRVVEDDEVAARQRIDTLRREAAGRGHDLEGLRREMAVLDERRQSQRRLRAELRAEIEQLSAGYALAQLQCGVMQAAAAELETEVAGLAASLAASETAFAQSRQDGELTDQVVRAREEAVRFQERAVGLRERLRQLNGERAELVADIAQRRSALVAREAALRRLVERGAAQKTAVDDLNVGLNVLAKATAEAGREADRAEETIQQVAGRARALERDLGQERARLEILERWRDSHSAYASGVRSVLRAAENKKGGEPQLAGVVGVAADLLRVPQDLETAIEVALGGRAQEIVVYYWKDAEAAIDFLKASGTGRATFLPLDTLKIPATGNPLALHESGVRGVASGLVGYDKQYYAVVAQLLGRTLIVEDLSIARRVLDLCPSGWQIVTIDGEIVRTSGAVTGGARKGSEVGLLARQRELLHLRERVAALGREAADVADQLVAARADHANRRRELGALEGRRKDSEIRLRAASGKLSEVNAEMRVAGEELRRIGSEITAKEDLLLRSAAQIASGEQEVAAMQSQAAAAVETASSLQERKEQIDREQSGALAELAEQRTRVAVRSRELAGQRALIAAREHELQDAISRLREKDLRLATLAEEGSAADASLEALSAAESVARDSLDRCNELIEPENKRLDALAAARREIEEGVVAFRERLAASDVTRRETIANLDRVRERMSQAQEQAEAELGHAVAEEIWSVAGESAVFDETLEIDDVKRRLDKVRASLRSIGMVNPLAITEHEEARARHEFLTREAHDTEEAAKDLRSLSLDLQHTMQSRFEKTFAAVGAQFRHYFTRLFGGGTARLVLSPNEDFAQAGVEIVAQPPGRRLQNLSLLSGGERALTATALLFAVLAVKPIPFCILDEVDAALDEANVGRFCQVLRELSAQTQFLVITHNRNTMEIADALYGISMPADSVSQVISLRAPVGAGEDIDDVWQVATP